MKNKNIEKKFNRISKIEKELNNDFNESFNQSLFYGIQYVFLDIIFGMVLTLGIILLSAFLVNNLGIIDNIGYIPFAIGFVFFFWVQGEDIYVLKGNKYTLYNWKTGALKRDKKINEMKNILEDIKNEAKKEKN